MTKSFHPAFNKVISKYIKDLDSTAYILEHKKTGAQVMYLKNTDTNKAFAISFKTIPTNNTGVAHILEHAVLNGSKKYPVKEPFTFLLKSSTATFINAVTYPDKTLYPVASTNEADLYNLSQVYLDAVFNPLITKETFMQEGWHYELFDKNEPIKFKGVVFNEMKGAYATIDDQVDNALRKNLHAGSSFAVDSGGDPEHIPDLTYEEFIKFHADCYNPTNSKSLIYGDLDPVRFLDLLDECFAKYQKGNQSDFIPMPKKIGPTEIIEKFAVSEAGEQKPIFIQSWLFEEEIDPLTYFTLEVLEYLILRSEASSVKKALLASELGESFYEMGYFPYTAYNFFAFGLRGLHTAENAQKVKKIIFDEIEALSKGIDPKLLGGAINKIEFSYRTEIGFYNNRGLANFSLTTKFWHYNKDPLDVFVFEEHFAKLRESLNKGYFEDFLAKNFLQNPRKLSLTMLPDKDLLALQNASEEKRLTEYKNSLSDEQLQELIQTNNSLKKAQDEPDSEAALQTLPTLKLADIEKKAREYPIFTLAGAYEKTFVENSENGVVEVQLIFDISHVPQDLIPYLSLYSQSILRIGTFKKNPEELAKQLDLYFGKIDTFVFVSKHEVTGEILKKFVISFKTLKQNELAAFDLIEEILFEVDFANSAKLREIIMEEKDNRESEIMRSGHTLVGNFALGAFREDAYYADSLDGISAYLFYKKLAQELDTLEADVMENLVFIHTRVCYKKGFSANIGTKKILAPYYFEKVDKIYEKFLNKTHKGDLENKLLLPKLQKRAFVIPSKVNYVGMAFDASKQLTLKGLIWPVNLILRLEYLWNEVRVKGGAYGVFSQFQSDGIISMASYRDPNISATLTAYEKSGDFLKSAQITPSQLENFKISSINRFEPHVNSDRIVFASWKNYVLGLTQEVRQAYKDSIYNVTLAKLKQIGESFNKATDQPKNIAVLGGKDSIQTYEFDEVIELF